MMNRVYPNEEASRLHRFGDIAVDEQRLLVTRAGQPVDLEPKGLRVLLYLIEHRERVVSKEELFGQVWKGVAVTDNALTRVVGQLRRTLGDDARQARYIETVPTVGYRFVGELIPGEPAPAAPMPVAPKPRSWLPWAAVGATAVMAFIAWTAPVWRTAATAPPPFLPRQLTNSPTLDASPSLSPDGRSLVYASDRTGTFELYVRQLVPGARDIAITSDGGNNIQASWSPDGRFIAYHSAARGTLEIVPSLGGPVRRLSSFGTKPVWSPDGQWIAFCSVGFLSFAPVDGFTVEPAELWVANVASGELRKLMETGPLQTGALAPAWSPDGRWLLFAHEKGLEAVALDGGARRTLLDSPRRPLLSPVANRRFVYYVEMVKAGANVLWRLPVGPDLTPAGPPMEVTRLSGTPQELRLSGDGRHLTYSLVTMDSNLWSLPLDRAGALAGPPAPFTRNTNYRNSYPAYSPDGRRVAFIARRVGQAPEVTLLSSDGSAEETVLAAPMAPVHLHFTADSRGLLFVRGKQGGFQAHVLDLETRQTQPVSPLVNSEALIPALWGSRLLDDRTTALVHARRSSGAGIGVALYDVKTRSLRWLTPEDRAVAFPSASPDGRHVAAEVFENHGSRLAVFPLSGKEPMTVLPSGLRHSWVHSWSPDGERIALAGQRGGAWNIYWQPIRPGEEPKQLTSERSARLFVRYPAWSPQGGRMLYERVEIKGNIYLADVE